MYIAYTYAYGAEYLLYYYYHANNNINEVPQLPGPRGIEGVKCDDFDVGSVSRPCR